MPTTTPKGRTALQKKQKERADLKSGDIIWIGIAATEQNIQRFAAFLMFADYHKEEKPLGPLPYDDPFEAAPPPELEVDWTSVRNAILEELKKLYAARGEEGKNWFLKRCQEHGGEKLSLVPNDNLMGLLQALQKENA